MIPSVHHPANTWKHLHDLHLVYLTPSTWPLQPTGEVVWQEMLTTVFPLLSAITSSLAASVLSFWIPVQGLAPVPSSRTLALEWFLVQWVGFKAQYHYPEA